MKIYIVILIVVGLIVLSLGAFLYFEKDTLKDTDTGDTNTDTTATGNNDNEIIAPPVNENPNTQARRLEIQGTSRNNLQPINIPPKY